MASPDGPGRDTERGATVTRRAKRWIIAAGVVGLAGAVLGVAYLTFRPPADLRAFGAIRAEWDAAGRDADPATQAHLAERCLDVSREHPGTTGGLAALLLAASHAPATPQGQAAGDEFARQVETADPDALAGALRRASGRLRAVPHLAAPLLARVRAVPGHPRCGPLLAACCVMLAPVDDGEASPTFQEAAALLADRHADGAEIHPFAEVLAGTTGSPPWAAKFERHLRAILAANRDRAVRCAAAYALASVLLLDDDRQADAEAAFASFCDEFDGTHPYPYQGIEQNHLHTARVQLAELRFHAAGKPASAIDGVDLDGEPLRLGDSRGRVVLLSFWGSWCFPCLKLVPHERDLVAAYRDRPFDLLGVSCGDDVEKAKATAARTGMTWRSFRDEAAGRPKITKSWKILGYPTLYLIDHHGVIRKRWVGSPTTDELDRLVAALVEAAERRIPAEGMKAVVASATRSAAPVPPAEPRGGGRFVEKVHRGPDGAEAKYAIYVPSAYDGTKSVPAILYLHGSGPRGSDGRAHLATGLAKVLRERHPDFPFLAVFPQARAGEDWQAGGPGARRGLAILAEAEKEYRIDPDRVALTGVSMGGAGTWSLAAAEPGRWSAIVPVSHGGDAATAGKLVGVPCWCFHGAADKMIPPQQSRDMVEAIAKAGGRPLYQELAGVGHNDCAERVYASPDLVEWLLLQNRSRR